jgi:hypothetical protein
MQQFSHEKAMTNKELVSSTGVSHRYNPCSQIEEDKRDEVENITRFLRFLFFFFLVAGSNANNP